MIGERVRIHSRVQFRSFGAADEPFWLQAGVAMGATATPVPGDFAVLGDPLQDCPSVGIPANDLGATAAAEATHTHTVPSLSETTTAGTSHTHDISTVAFIVPRQFVGWTEIHVVTSEAPYVLGLMVRAYSPSSGAVASADCYGHLVVERI
jgi:hypothetical protein